MQRLVDKVDIINYSGEISPVMFMKENSCLHLAVFDDDNFVGIVSVRDILALMLSEKEALITRMQDYISS